MSSLWIDSIYGKIFETISKHFGNTSYSLINKLQLLLRIWLSNIQKDIGSGVDGSIN